MSSIRIIVFSGRDMRGGKFSNCFIYFKKKEETEMKSLLRLATLN
jgi:hypothetical protein